MFQKNGVEFTFATDKNEITDTNTATLEPINSEEEALEDNTSATIISNFDDTNNNNNNNNNVEKETQNNDNQDAANANISAGAKSIITETPSTATLTPINNEETATLISSHHASILSKNTENDVNSQIENQEPLMPSISLQILGNKKK